MERPAGNAADRMPTPIQPNFAAQVRGLGRSWAGPCPADSSVNSLVNMENQQSGSLNYPSVPLSAGGDVDWHMAQNNRQLPSPIFEVGGDCTDCQAAGLANMMIDEVDALVDASQTNASLQGPSSVVGANSQLSADPRPPSPLQGRRGHTRSKHTVNTWTCQPGMKRSFSIGYRADCEKCRLRVPGHFNHIIIS